MIKMYGNTDKEEKREGRRRGEEKKEPKKEAQSDHMIREPRKGLAPHRYPSHSRSNQVSRVLRIGSHMSVLR